MRTLALAMLLLLVGPARAETPDWQPPPDLRIAITNLLVARYNPLGLEDQLRIGLQARLLHHSSPLLRDTFVFFGLAPRMSPSFIKFGPSLEVQPIAVFNLRMTAELMKWFPTFGHLQSFTSFVDDWSDDALKAGSDAGRNYAPTGVHFFVEPTLQAKVEFGRAGALAVRNRLSLEYWNMNLRAGDNFFYDPTLDTLVPRDGWVLANDLDVLFLTRFRFIAGVRYSAVHPFYPGGEKLNDQQRIGPLFAYTFFDRYVKHVSKPTLILITNWYVSHRYRENGIPYLVLGFAFVSDFALR